MEIGDIVNVKIECMIKGPNADKRKEMIESGALVREIPEEGIVEYMNDRFATLMMINKDRKRIYRKSFYYDQMFIKEKENV